MAPPPPSRMPSPPPRFSWPAVVGFGALGLLWPLLRLLGLEDALGDLPTTTLALVSTLTVWVLGAGLGRVPRPVLTLTLAGVVFAILLRLTMIGVGGARTEGGVAAVVAAMIQTAGLAGLGALAGLVSAAIQRWLRVGR